MPILNFNKKFASKVKRGTKRHTIRAHRKFPIDKGDILYLYTGLRSNNARKLREAKCKEVTYIEISDIRIKIESLYYPYEGYRKLIASDRALDNFARSDGFKDWSDMKSWWLKIHGLPFQGTLIKW